MIDTRWTLVANAAHARLFRQELPGPMTEIRSLQHPDSRRRSSELGDAAAGREPTDRGFGGAAFEPRLPAQRKEQLRFAQELADLLEAGARQGSYASLRVFASSPFLGELKQALGSATRRLLVAAHDVDLCSVGLAEMEGRIRHELAQPR